MLLSELIGGLPGGLVRSATPGVDPAGVWVGDVTEDSRTAVPGSLFVARRGRSSDGRAFAAAAAEAGATAVLTDDAGVVASLSSSLPSSVAKRVAVVVADDVRVAGALAAERFFGSPSSSLRLVGVTGTNGKTTVATLVHRLLNAAGLRCGLIGTVEIDDGAEVAPAEMTTPPAVELSRTLSVMVESGCRAAVMEVSSHALDQRRADGLSFVAAVFTNLSGDHLDYHGDMASYLGAKRRLFELLGRGEVGGGGGGARLAVVNGEDEASAAMVSAAGGARAVSCSLRAGDGLDGVGLEAIGPDGAEAVRVSAKEASLSGMRLSVEGAGLSVSARVGLVGAHNAMNAAQAAVAASWVLETTGLGRAEAVAAVSRGLTLVRGPAGRLEPVHGPVDDVAVLVDYAHTDDALDKVLAGVRPLVPAGRSLWVVFGAGGDRDRTKRPRMGAAAARWADRVVLTSDNPRTESPSAIIGEVLSGVPADRRDRAEVQADRACAIAWAVGRAGPGDVVVIAGKGHEREQVTADRSGRLVRTVFDDGAEARAALSARRARLGAGAAVAAG